MVLCKNGRAVSCRDMRWHFRRSFSLSFFHWFACHRGRISWL